MSDLVILAKEGSMHHARIIAQAFENRCVMEREWVPDKVLSHRPALVVTFDEHYCELALCISAAIKSKIATLLVRDGILEWRMVWEYPTSEVRRPVNQPALSDKIACLGSADARIMESWGNVGKCEIVGVPRFDNLIAKRRERLRTATVTEKMRLLIMTAKTPGFSTEQIEATYRSLQDLRDSIADRSDIHAIWRVTQNLHKRLGVTNSLDNVLSSELHDMLPTVDAVVTTASTSMLEAMLCGRPLALLDYHNCPHYVTAAWRITAKEQISQTLNELRSPSLAKMLYQDYILSDALSCRSPALPRLVWLIEEMIRIRRESLASGGKRLQFPHRILLDPEEHVAWPSTAFDLRRLYPHHKVFAQPELVTLQAELEAALGTINELRRQTTAMTARLNAIPGYRILRRMYHTMKKGTR